MIGKKLLVITLCISLCFTFSGCKMNSNSENSKTESNKEEIVTNETKEEDKLLEENLEDNEDSKSEEIVSLSDKDKKNLSNLFNEYDYVESNDITNFVSWVVNHNEIINFSKNEKTDSYRYAIKPELGAKIVSDSLGLEVSKESFKLNEYGNIDIIEAAGETTKTFINKVVKTGEKEYSVYVSKIYYPVEGASLNSSNVYNIKENSDSMFGYTIINRKKCDELDWIPETISASSSLKSDSNSSYQPNNLFDKKISTAWVEGAEGVGIGEYILLESSKSQAVSGVFIDNGYLKSDDLLRKNGAITKVRFEFSDGTIIDSDLYKTYSNSLFKEPISLYTDYINFGREIETTSIKMTILEASAGTEYEDTCVSEIRFVK